MRLETRVKQRSFVGAALVFTTEQMDEAQEGGPHEVFNTGDDEKTNLELGLDEVEEGVHSRGDTSAERGTIAPLALDLLDVGTEVGSVFLGLGPLVLRQLTRLGVGNESLTNAISAFNHF